MISRQLVKGDIIIANKQAVMSMSDMTEGRAYRIRHIDGDGDGKITDDYDHTRYIGRDRYSFFTLKEDANITGYISVRECTITEGEPTIITLEVDDVGFRTIEALVKTSEADGQRRVLREQIITLQKRLEALG